MSSSTHIAEVYRDKGQEWRWRVKAANNEVVATGEAYTRKEDAIRGLQEAKVEYGELHVDDRFLD